MNSLINIIINAETTGAVAGMNRVSNAANLMSNQMTATERAMASTASTARTLQTSMLAMASGLGFGQLVQMSDQYTKYVAQLKIATGSTAAFSAANEEVSRIAKATQGGLEPVGVLYARIASATRDLGTSQQDVSKITETVGLSLKVAGASAQETSSTMLQLSQSFASGKLNGQEYAAVMESAPGLMQILADSMGLPKGALKDLSEQGKLTNEVMTRAFTNDATLSGLRTQANEINTISGAYTLLRDELMTFVGTQAQSSGIVSAITSGIGGLVKNLDLLSSAAVGFGAAKLAQVLLNTGVASLDAAQKTIAAAQATNFQRAASIAHAEAAVAESAAISGRLVATQAALVVSREEAIAKMSAGNASIAAATASIAQAESQTILSTANMNLLRQEAALTAATEARSVATAELALLGQQQVRVSAQITAAAAAQTTAQNALTTAQGAGTAASGLASGAIAALGGPIGLITLALGVCAAAWMYWGQSAKDNAEKAEKSVFETAKSITQSLDSQIKKIDERNAALNYKPSIQANDQAEAIGGLQQKITQLEGLKTNSQQEEVVRLVELNKLLAARGQIEVRVAEFDKKTAEEKSRREKAAAGAAAQEILQKQSGIPKTYLTDLKTLKDALDTGAISHDAYTKAVSTLAKETYKASAAGKEAAKSTAAGTKAAKEANTQYNDLMLRVSERIALADDEIKAGRPLTEAQKQEIKLTELLDSAKGKVNASQRAAIEGALAEVRAKEMLVQQQHTQAQAQKELAEADAKRVHEIESSLPAIAEQNKSLVEEIELLGLSEQAQFAITQVRLSSAIALKEEQLARMQNTEFMSREQIALEEEIRLMKEKLGLQGQKFAKNTAVEEAKKAEEEWKKFYEDIEHGLTDSLYRAFESGNGFFETFWSSIKNLFKTTVLKLAVQAVVGGVTGAASSVVNSGLSAIGLGSSGVGTSALGSLVSSALGSITLGGSTISAIGSSVATGVSAGLAGTSLAGASAAYGAAGMSGVASGLSVGSSIGTAMAAIPGWGWAAMGAAALGSVLGGKGDSRFGGRYSYDETNGAQYQQGPTHQDSASGVERVIVNATADYVNSTFKLLGSTQRLTGIDAGYESSEKGKGFSFAAGTIGGKAIGDQNSYNNNRGSKTAEQAFSEFQRELDQLKIQALQAAGDVPKIIADQLKGIDANSLSQEQAASVIAGVNAQITAVQGLQQSLNAMPFDSLKNLSFTAAAGLVAAAGGLEALNTKLNSYYENFYSSEEKRANTLKNIGSAFTTAGLGVTAEQLATMTRGQYRQLYEYVSKNWGESSSMAMSVLNLSDQFANITPAAEAAVQAVAGVSDALKKLQGDTANLQIELMRAQGNTAGADAAQYTIDTTGMTEAERAIFDYNRALRAQITALTDASAAAEKTSAAVEKTNAAIRSNAKSAIESAVAAFEKSKSNPSDALAALEKSINAEKTRITVIRDVAAESVRSITGIFSALDEQVKQLYGTVSSTSVMQASQGNDYINKALSTALSTGYLPDAKGLSDAISAARTGLGQDKFSSKFEADKASLVLAGKLTQLQTASGKQLTEAERQLQVSNDQLAALDKSLEMYKQQVDALNGINTSVLSVADAVSGLLGAMQAQSAAKAAVQAAQAQGAASLYASNPNAVKNPGQEGLDFWQGQIASKGYDATASTFDASVTYANDTVKSWYAGNPDAVKNPDSGAVQYWLGQIDAMGADAAKAKFSGVVGAMTGNAARPVNSFAVGINRVPFDMTAEIHKDEAIVPAVFNPFNPAAMTAGAGANTGADTRELLAEIRRLNARLERIEAYVASTSRSAERSALVLDDASRGKRPLKTEAAT